MAKVVIKRGGKREPFRAEKVKGAVRGACRDIHMPAAPAKRVVSRVAGPVLRFAAKRKTVRAATLRKKVLAGLKKVEPAAAKAWMRYERRRRDRRGKK